jgi:glycosyltransferase involved in cell wall biosynthesis
VLADNSRLDWEIIIVDDASPDGTQDVAHQLAKIYGQDKVVSVYRDKWGIGALLLVSSSFSSPGSGGMLTLQVLKPRAGKLGLG